MISRDKLYSELLLTCQKNKNNSTTNLRLILFKLLVSKYKHNRSTKLMLLSIQLNTIGYPVLKNLDKLFDPVQSHGINTNIFQNSSFRQSQTKILDFCLHTINVDVHKHSIYKTLTNGTKQQVKKATQVAKQSIYMMFVYIWSVS